MPHKFYHGKTGRVWNVTKRAVGVEVTKLVGNRILKKRIHVRVEHVNHSACRKDFLRRVKENEQKKRDAKANKQKAVTKRVPQQPRPAAVVDHAKTTLETVYPLEYVFTA
eukprot:TRINITY_DN40807_c0_g1_i1.p3 TRINITY_DN40807_c0_g1~~TRINITY_DN40807_c0_g1_i1.p3  ORF type:complete len:110 (+),score=25.51 TRINITY_DN40807_c0_g1_i1:1-330(+)